MVGDDFGDKVERLGRCGDRSHLACSDEAWRRGARPRRRCLQNGALEAGADLLIVDRFGKRERHGNGLGYLVERALRADIPVVIAVSSHRLADWIKFAGGMGVKLACDRHALESWWCTVSRPSCDDQREPPNEGQKKAALIRIVVALLRHLLPGVRRPRRCASIPAAKGPSSSIMRADRGHDRRVISDLGKFYQHAVDSTSSSGDRGEADSCNIGSIASRMERSRFPTASG